MMQQTFLGEASVTRHDLGGKPQAASVADAIPLTFPAGSSTTSNINEDSITITVKEELVNNNIVETNATQVLTAQSTPELTAGVEASESRNATNYEEAYPQAVSTSDSELSVLTPLETSADEGRDANGLRAAMDDLPTLKTVDKSGPEAMNIFGPTIPLYSITGPPGGVFIGTGLVQCDPVDEGRVSVIVQLEPNVQFVVTNNADGKISRSGRRQNKKVTLSVPPAPPKAKRKPKPKRAEPMESLSASDVEGGPSAPKRMPSQSSTGRAIRSSRRYLEDATPEPMTRDTPIRSALPPKKAPRQRRILGEYERDNSPQMVQRMCHQCRGSKSTYAKMLCNNTKADGSSCQSVYCHKCIATRYPDISFKSRKRFKCPRCSGTCNCDVCTKKRGEPYLKTYELLEVLSNRTVSHSKDSPSRALQRIRPAKTAADDSSLSSAKPAMDEEASLHSMQQRWERKTTTRPSSHDSSRDEPQHSGEEENVKFNGLTEDGAHTRKATPDSPSRRRLYIGDARELRRRPSTTSAGNLRRQSGQAVDSHEEQHTEETTKMRSKTSVRPLAKATKRPLVDDNSESEGSADTTRPKKKSRKPRIWSRSINPATTPVATASMSTDESSASSSLTSISAPASEGAAAPLGTQSDIANKQVEDDSPAQVALGTPLSSDLSEPDLTLEYPSPNITPTDYQTSSG